MGMPCTERELVLTLAPKRQCLCFNIGKQQKLAWHERERIWMVLETMLERVIWEAYISNSHK